MPFAFLSLCSPAASRVFHGIRPQCVPEGFLELHKSFKIHSKQFVYETLTGWGLDPEKTYSFKGEYFEERKIIIFLLKSI